MSESTFDRDFYVYDANHRFAPMYPLLARQIVEDLGVSQGLCLDVGTGSAAVIIELAKITPLAMVGLDAKPEVLELARENVARHGLPEERFRFLEADVTAIPLESGSVDLLISRGSVPFWDDHVAAFAELYRVLAPGGWELFVTNLADTMQPVFLAYRRTLARFPERTKGAIVHHFPPSPAGLADGLRRCGVAVDELLSGEIAIATPAAEDIVDWLLKTGILAGFAEILPIHDDQDVRDYFRQELLLALKQQPLAHHYCLVKGARPC